MNQKLKQILDTIGFNEDYIQELKSAFLKSAKLDKKNKSLDVLIHNNTNLTIDAYENLEKAFKLFFNTDNINLYITVDSIDKDKLKQSYIEFIDKLESKRASLGIFKDSLTFEDDNIVLLVAHSREKKTLEKYLPEIINYLNKRGFSGEVSITISKDASKKVREEISKDIDKEISEVLVNSETKESKKDSFKSKYEKKELGEGVIRGVTIKDKSVPIKTIVGEEESVSIEGVVFDVEEFEPSSKAFKILTLKMTDYTDSLYCKVFVRDNDEFSDVKKKTKTGSWLKLRGSTKIDRYAGGDIVLNIRDINEIPPKEEKLVDKNEEKRVELHAHTQMSQMDGISNAKALVKLARNLGHKAVAITDHDGCQSFPDVYHTVCDINSNLKEGEEPFKAIYGTELTLIDDSVDIVKRGNDTKLFDNTYVVFDFETTGFNAAGGDTIIEIGAVKLLNGEIIDKFSELINPGRPLPKKITDLTGITDDMLKDCDDEETVVKRFIAWFGDLPMVAHNAKFDTSFLEMAYSKYNLGEFTNTIIDTLELSRVLMEDILYQHLLKDMMQSLMKNHIIEEITMQKLLHQYSIK